MNHTPITSEISKLRAQEGITDDMESFDREIRAMEQHRTDDSHRNRREIKTTTESNIEWVASVWKDPEVARGVENDIRMTEKEFIKGLDAEDARKIHDTADDLSKNFKDIHKAFSQGRSAQGAALMMEVKDKLQTLRRDAWWQRFLVHGQTNALQKLIGEQELLAAQFGRQEAEAELKNAHLDAEQMKRDGKARRKGGFLKAVISVVSIAAAIYTGGASSGTFDWAGAALA